MGRSVNSFKGFEPEEIIILYKYICWYKSISKISTDKKLYKQYPWTKSFWIDTSIKKYNFKIKQFTKAKETDKKFHVSRVLTRHELISFAEKIKNYL